MSSDCCNPCATPSTDCGESIPSQIANFTEAFFGTLTKEVDEAGNVTWILPCGLDEGIGDNPRVSGEGLACYFMRLFEDGLVNIQGEKGDAGVDGQDGQSAFTTTTADFTEGLPAPGNPVASIATVPCQAMLVGTNVFIPGSGWYQITASDTGTGLMSLIKLQNSGATRTVPLVITAGAFVIPTGMTGLTGATGATGAKGDTGATGAAGTSWTTANSGATSRLSANAATVANAWATVTFSPATPLSRTFTLAGLYYVSILVQFVVATEGTPAVNTLSVRLKLNGSVLDGSLKDIVGLVPGQRLVVPISMLVSPSAGQSLVVEAQAGQEGQVSIDGANTTFVHFRIAGA